MAGLMALKFIVLFAICGLGPGSAIVSRLAWSPLEKLGAAFAISFIRTQKGIFGLSAFNSGTHVLGEEDMKNNKFEMEDCVDKKRTKDFTAYVLFSVWGRKDDGQIIRTTTAQPYRFSIPNFGDVFSCDLSKANMVVITNQDLFRNQELRQYLYSKRK